VTSSSTSGGSAVLVPPRRAWKKARGTPPPGPPGDPGGGGGGGGGGDGATPGGAGAEDAGPFALALALGGITTLFAVLVAVWLLLRRPAPDWRAAGTGALNALWVSTACLVASSVAVERAVRILRARAAGSAGSARPAGRTGAAADDGAPRRWLAVGFALGLAFLAAQVSLWVLAWRAGVVPATSGYAAVFFAITGLHALHVSCGLGILGVLALRLGRGARSAASAAGSVRLGALYWHFMGLLWLVLFALLYFVR
jgi:heme/copper-type cytochrome/quinol oxidase subunit 3